MTWGFDPLKDRPYSFYLSSFYISFVLIYQIIKDQFSILPGTAWQLIYRRQDSLLPSDPEVIREFRQDVR